MPMQAPELPPPLGERVQRELEPGESAAWIGQPDPGRMMLRGYLAWLFFVPWTAFAVFWMSAASGFRVPDFSHGRASFFPLFGLPFLAIGVVGLMSPYWSWRRARNTVYVITNRRAFVLQGGRSYTVRSVQPDQLAGMTRKENPDGSGDILFPAIPAADGGVNSRGLPLGFLCIGQVRDVERRIARLAAPAPELAPADTLLR